MVKSLVSFKQLTRKEIEFLLQKAYSYQKKPPGSILQGKILANLFFEPSTRTRLSFESAMKKMGGECIGIEGEERSSLSKGETLSDTIAVVSRYADIIVIRHPEKGSAKLAADASSVPVINGGDGTNEHPTQTLLDLFTIWQTQKTLDHLHLVVAGDLKNGRTVHSLVLSLHFFNPTLYFVPIPGLEMPFEICQFLREQGIKFSTHSTIEEVMPQADILYLTRVQKERNSIGAYSINKKTLERAKPNLKVLHPLPRVDEIDTEVDATPYAHYFDQAANGVVVRQALIVHLLEKCSC
ncbi:MAG: aspartate carbamoyltransferase [Chlamydiia bacterium]|nr:aspartate carbamoyltransferase [Chlamydiia bacterium]